VAQLVARAVWDREVEGSSPFTPTKKRSVHLGGFFLAFGGKDLNLRLFRKAKNKSKVRVAIKMKNVYMFL
jgi:hypothetical protein